MFLSGAACGPSVLPNCQLARFSARAGGGQSSAADDHKSALKSGQGEGGGGGQFLDLVQRAPIM